MKDWNELYTTITYATEKKDYTRLLYSFGVSESQQVKNNVYLRKMHNHNSPTFSSQPLF